MPANLMEYFNKEPRLGVLSTSDRNGRVDSAVFGSPHMVDEKTVVAATAKRSRTFSNLLENPDAVYIIMKPGNSILDWKGIRVYMKMKNYATFGEMLETFRNESAKSIGEEAAKMIEAVLTFEIYEVRPLVDFGQGWEKSI